MKEAILKTSIKAMTIKDSIKNRIFSDRGASEMVAVVVLIVLVLAVAVLALPDVREVLIDAFEDITRGIEDVGAGALD